MINGNFVSIVGGVGHVGAPLGLALSSKGYNVILVDKNKENIKKLINENLKADENAFYLQEINYSRMDIRFWRIDVFLYCRLILK